MTKNDMLNYLQRKRIATAPVATAENNVSICRNKFNSARNKFKFRIGILGFLVIFNIFLKFLSMRNPSSEDNLNGRRWKLFYYSSYNGTPQLTYLGIILILLILLISLKIWKKKRYVDPAYNNLVNAEQVLNDAINDPNYINEAQSFPSEFYNYTDTYRLWRLIDEGRAISLQDAYNLLEKQHFYEDQLAIQEEIRSLQQDTAVAARATAVASTMTAYNTAKMNQH
ncbi:hypothetical protein CF160_11150 [Enterococcus pseudoavium]|nr:hypothetical protein CF160_11150 [Enterococcus pseudoavium]